MKTIRKEVLGSATYRTDAIHGDNVIVHGVGKENENIADGRQNGLSADCRQTAHQQTKAQTQAIIEQSKKSARTQRSHQNDNTNCRAITCEKKRAFSHQIWMCVLEVAVQTGCQESLQFSTPLPVPFCSSFFFFLVSLCFSLSA